MKRTLLILIGYITCSLKCEMNKTEAEKKTDNVEPLNDKDQQVDVQRPEDAKQPEDVNTTDAVDTTTAAAGEDTTYTVNITVEAAAADTTYGVEQSDNTKQPEDVETSDAIDTIDAIDTTTQNTRARWYAVPVNTEQPEDVEKTDAVDTTTAAAGEDTTYTVNTTAEAATVDTTYDVEQPDNTEQPEDGEMSDSVDTTYAVEQPVDKEQPEDVEQPVNTEQKEDVEKTETTKKQERPTDDTGPSKIKVEDALKILEKSKKKYTSESIALIKKLEWLRSTFNITELMIDHKIDPNEDFDELSNTEDSLNSSNILRQRVKDGFLHVKNAIMKISKFKQFEPEEQIKLHGNNMAMFAQANKYKENFIATHSDRDNLKKIHLADSD